ncbi:uncharacterized protein LOC142622901 [Castanea sativa]|uniref:uncharacterized protein LOC142622901 n=1 Tax=Castanea sativa TaxID=21020 RepID=UPI003F64AB74
MLEIFRSAFGFALEKIYEAIVDRDLPNQTYVNNITVNTFNVVVINHLSHSSQTTGAVRSKNKDKTIGAVTSSHTSTGAVRSKNKDGTIGAVTSSHTSHSQQTRGRSIMSLQDVSTLSTSPRSIAHTSHSQKSNVAVINHPFHSSRIVHTTTGAVRSKNKDKTTIGAVTSSHTSHSQQTRGKSIMSLQDVSTLSASSRSIAHTTTDTMLRPTLHPRQRKNLSGLRNVYPVSQGVIHPPPPPLTRLGIIYSASQGVIRPPPPSLTRLERREYLYLQKKS